jgi:hypothetical protein
MIISILLYISDNYIWRDQNSLSDKITNPTTNNQWGFNYIHINDAIVNWE